MSNTEQTRHAGTPDRVAPAGAGGRGGGLRRHWVKPFLALVIVAFCALVVALFLMEGTGGRTVREALVPAQRTPFASVLHESGIIEALNETVVLSRITGDIVWKEEDGKLVEAGDPIVRFETKTVREDIESREKDVGDRIDALRRAKEAIAITQKRSAYVVRQAELTLELATLARKRVYDAPTPDDKLDAELSLKSAALDLERAEVEGRNYEELAGRGFVSEAKRKEKVLDLVIKKAEHAKAKLIYDLTLQGSPTDTKRVADLAVADARKQVNVAKFNRDADLAVCNAAYELAKVDLANGERELNRRRKDLEWATVRAPVRGHVVFTEVYKGSSKNKSAIEVGESRSAGGDLCTICDTSTLRVRVWINESDIKHVTLGQRALVRLPAFPGRNFEAVVSELAVLAMDKNVAVSSLALRRAGEAFVNVVQAKLNFVNLSEEDRQCIRVGFTADVFTQTTAVSEALTVPWLAVRFGPDNVPFVEVPASLGRERRALKLGRSDAFRAEVLDGLQENEKVYDLTGSARPGFVVPAPVYCEPRPATGGS